VLDAEEFQGSRRAAVQFLALDAAHRQAALDVAAHRRGQQVSLLEHGGRVAAQTQPVGAALDRPPPEEELAVRALQPVQRAQQGGLAGAVRPEQRVHRALLHRELRYSHERLASAHDHKVAGLDDRLSVAHDALEPCCWMMVIA